MSKRYWMPLVDVIKMQLRGIELTIIDRRDTCEWYLVEFA